MKDIRQKLLSVFETEYREHLEFIRAWATSGTQARQDKTQREEAQRRVHSLKGAARAVDMPQVETLAHELESAFAMILRQPGPLADHHQELIDQALNCIEDSVIAYRTGQPPPDATGLRQRLSDLRETPDTRATESGIGAEVKPVPPVPNDSHEPHPAPASGTTDHVWVGVNALDRLLETAGEISTETNRLSEITGALDQCLGMAKRLLDQEKNRISESTRLEARALVERIAETLLDHENAVWQHQLSARKLRARAANARMITVSNLFSGVRKTVRDLAGEMGKEVTVSITGLTVKADRSVLQALVDPVQHMLRNAVSHGIETPAERRQAGKNPGARIGLHFESHNHRLHVSVTDDGRGLDHQAILQQGIAAGLVSGQTREVPAEKLLELICNTGLSTAEDISRIAGRGLGMSVVRQAVNGIQGKLSVQSSPGQGTTFFLVVPITTASTRTVLVRSGNHVFALPAHEISRVVRLPAGPLLAGETRGPLVVLEGENAPVSAVRLADWIAPQVNTGPQTEEHYWGLLTGVASERRCLLVDEVLTVRDAIVARLPPPADRMTAVTGAVHLDQGRAAPCLNVAAIRRSEVPWRTSAEATPGSTESLPHILVVDDSITTRTLERSILETRGYPVSVAVDGVQALQLLQSQAIDLIIADVEMPNMNGFQLLEQLKADPCHAEIPVIMVTSRASREDRLRGMNLGAAAYLEKQSFNQSELLQTIGLLT